MSAPLQPKNLNSKVCYMNKVIDVTFIDFHTSEVTTKAAKFNVAKNLEDFAFLDPNVRNEFIKGEEKIFESVWKIIIPLFVILESKETRIKLKGTGHMYRITKNSKVILAMEYQQINDNAMIQLNYGRVYLRLTFQNEQTYSSDVEIIWNDDLNSDIFSDPQLALKVLDVLQI